MEAHKKLLYSPATQRQVYMRMRDPESFSKYLPFDVLFKNLIHQIRTTFKKLDVEWLAFQYWDGRDEVWSTLTKEGVHLNIEGEVDKKTLSDLPYHTLLSIRKGVTDRAYLNPEKKKVLRANGVVVETYSINDL